MDIGLRFYQKHDLDIVELKQNPSFSFTYWFKEALRASMNGDTDFEIPLPPPSTTKNINELRSCMYHLILDDIEDKDLIDYVLNFTSGYRNAVLKNIFRSYLELPNVIPYYSITKNVAPPPKKKHKAPPAPIVRQEEKSADNEDTLPPLPDFKDDGPAKEAEKPVQVKQVKPAPTFEQKAEPLPKKEEPNSDAPAAGDSKKSFDLFSAVDKLT